MSAPMERTRHPGIFKRGDRYVVTYRLNGKLKKESCRTLADARRLKAHRTSRVASGEFTEQSRVGFREYAEEWIERYAGKGRAGFRESTRYGYRRDLRRWVFQGEDETGRVGGFFSARVRLAEVTPHHIARFVGWLAEQHGANGRPLADSTIRNILNPVRACFASAVREGLIRTNPAAQIALPYRPTIADEDPEEVQALTREELGTFLALVPPRHETMFRLLAGTGLRIGEVLALQYRHLLLDGSRPVVRVRRSVSRGARVEPPKSRHGRREVPLDHGLVLDLRDHRGAAESAAPENLVFPTRTGRIQSYSNLRQRVLKPTADEAGVAWIGFHTFRHTFASLHIARGTNVVQLSRLLGHHSAAFTLSTYVHLIDGDVGDPLSLDAELNREAAAEDTPRSGLSSEARWQAPSTSMRQDSGMSH